MEVHEVTCDSSWDGAENHYPFFVEGARISFDASRRMDNLFDAGLRELV